jgi:hypothetical protein
VRRHDTDYVSFVAGVLFLVVAAVYIAAAAYDADLDMRWMLPAVLILLGVVGLMGALRGAGRPTQEVTAGAAAEAAAAPAPAAAPPTEPAAEAPSEALAEPSPGPAGSQPTADTEVVTEEPESSTDR